jgi:alpha-galactosidase
LIIYENNIFHAQTKNTSYVIGIREGGYIEQLYYGRKIRNTSNYAALYEKIATGYGNSNVTPQNNNLTLDNLCLEYSYSGTGDYRHLPLALEMPDHGYSNDFLYVSHEMYGGTYHENDKTNMPFAKGNEAIYLEDVFTLDICLKDSVYPIYLHLIYTFFYESDVITRRVKIENRSNDDIRITKAMSMMLDLPSKNYDLHTFDGLWIRERQENKKKLVSGIYVNDSTTGSSSNRHNPFIFLADENCSEETGECYGFNLLYSGNHYEAVEVSEYGKVRIMSGINPYQFAWTLKVKEVFYTPEAVLSYSFNGKNGLSHNMHYFINRHIISTKWAYKERPILINNWEATYFDFNESKLLEIAREAKNLGMEMLVLDDGWFSNRSDDSSSLGDWTVNEEKLGGPLKDLVTKINDLGLKFGIWFEPEMISENSKLYKKYPDWAIRAPKRKAYIGRNQFVLDLTIKEVREYIVDAVISILKSAPIEYVKWDMNRHISDAYSSGLFSHQGEFYHRYILGLYEVMDNITKAFPDVLFEGCSAGGNRFDLGILSYMPQIWTSDNTDANQRTHIQQGTSFGYPLSTMTAHVSAVPNHQTLRNTAIETRFNIACFGVLGYEIDITKLTAIEKNAVSEQIKFYKEHRSLFQFGNFTRIQSDENHVIWQVVSDDKKEAIALIYQRLAIPNGQGDILKVKDLLLENCYDVKVRKQHLAIFDVDGLKNIELVKETNESKECIIPINEKEEYEAYGDLLMYAGIKLSQPFVGIGYDAKTRVMVDFDSRLYVITSK